MIRPEIPPGNAEQMVSEYNALFEVIARSVIEYQFFVGNRLETKKRDNRDGAFDWGLGEGTSALPFAADADYALFIVTNDQYGSTGRKILQIFAALAVGYGVESGVHAGYAGLVDLRTGNLVWINADNAMGGDVRTPEGAARRVQQLLEDFPGSQPEAPSAP